VSSPDPPPPALPTLSLHDALPIYRPLVVAGAARRDQSRAVRIDRLKALGRLLIHGGSVGAPNTVARRMLHWARISVVLVSVLVTLQSVLWWPVPGETI